MRTLSSCKLSLMRALLFFSTRGFLICQNSKDNGVTLSVQSQVKTQILALSAHTGLLPFCQISSHCSYHLCPFRLCCCGWGPCCGSLTQARPEGAHWTGGWCVIQRAVTARQRDRWPGDPSGQQSLQRVWAP